MVHSLLTLSRYLCCKSLAMSVFLILWTMLWMSSPWAWMEERLMSSRALWCCFKYRKPGGNTDFKYYDVTSHIVIHIQSLFNPEKVRVSYLPAFLASHFAGSGGSVDLCHKYSEGQYGFDHTCWWAAVLHLTHPNMDLCPSVLWQQICVIHEMWFEVKWIFYSFFSLERKGIIKDVTEILSLNVNL